MRKINVDKLIALVRDNPGIYSLDIISRLRITSQHVRGAATMLNKERVKFLQMGEASPIAFQKAGGKLNWYTMEYAVKNQIDKEAEPTYRERNKDGEAETFMERCKEIDSRWLPGSA